MIGGRIINSMMERINRKIFLLLGRALLTLVNNTGQTGYYASGGRQSPQRLQVSALSGERLSDVERFQEYGMETHPVIGSAEAYIACQDGSRDNAVILCVQDKEYRPIDLLQGEVCLYTFNDSTLTHRITLKADGTIELAGGVTPPTGVVTGSCVCAFTGGPHPDFSTTVKATK